VIVAVIVWLSTTTMFDDVGEGPLPFSKETAAPFAKPEPLMVTFTEVPEAGPPDS